MTRRTKQILHLRETHNGNPRTETGGNLLMGSKLNEGFFFPFMGNLSIQCDVKHTWKTTCLVLLLLPMSVTGLEPGFITPLENITVAAGRSAQFTCVVKHLGGHKVAWLRSDSKAILAIHTHMVTNNPRMGVEHNGHNSWTLTVKQVQRNDSGNYMCQINTEPMTSQVGFLNVVEAPDILYNQTSNDTIVAEGASVVLRCEARGFPEPSISWKRADRRPIVLRNAKGSVIRVNSVEGSELKLSRVTRADMGPYLCIASNGIPSPVSKRIMIHVHFHPLVNVYDQIVSAPLGATVTLACSVEASPRSVNYWIMSRGEDEPDRAVNPGRRFMPLEEQESLYLTIVKLTIKEVRKTDLGNYTCISRNSLGNVSGHVTLRELVVVVPVQSGENEAKAPSNGSQIERARPPDPDPKSEDNPNARTTGKPDNWTSIDSGLEPQVVVPPLPYDEVSSSSSSSSRTDGASYFFESINFKLATNEEDPNLGRPESPKTSGGPGWSGDRKMFEQDVLDGLEPLEEYQGKGPKGRSHDRGGAAYRPMANKFSTLTAIAILRVLDHLNMLN